MNHGKLDGYYANGSYRGIQRRTHRHARRAWEWRAVALTLAAVAGLAWWAANGSGEWFAAIRELVAR